METEEHAAMTLAGGILQHGYQCGMLWGATLAAGAQAFHLYGATARAEVAAMNASRKLVERFLEREVDINCLEITETDWNNKWQMTKFLAKGGGIRCLKKVVGFAPEALEVIVEALKETPEQTFTGPVSCAARMAREMGASEKHAVMAAGLAAGIGMSGGACGALGAAIWVLGLEDTESKAMDRVKSPVLADTVDRFLKATDHEFECAEIVGKKFGSITEHACHVRAGGCSDIMATLASKSNQGAEIKRSA